MPSDIRSFFGGKPAASAAKPAPEKVAVTKKRARSRKVVDEDEDDEEIVTAKETPRKKAKPTIEPTLEETTTDDYFGKRSRSKQSPHANGKSAPEVASLVTPKKSTPKSKATPNATTPNNSSARRTRNRIALESAPTVVIDDRDDDEDGDNFKSAAMVGGRMDDDYEEDFDDDDDDDIDFAPVTKATPSKTRSLAASKAANKAVQLSPKRKSKAIESDEDNDLDVEEQKPIKKRASPTKKAPGKSKKVDKAPATESAEMKAILDSIPTITPPSPPSNDGTTRKFQYGQHPNSATPAGAIDMSQMPRGADNCLAGLAFVFTGQLQRLSREQGQNLVKQYGGKVSATPGKNTSYVVLGDDAGPKKLQTIKTLSLKVIDETGLFALIEKMPANGGDSAAAAKQAEKRAQEEENVRKAAAEMEQQERAAAAKTKASAVNGKASATAPDTRLWTVRYAPTQVTQICGNKGQVEKLQRWLRNFQKNQKKSFKLPGPDGSGVYRAIMIHGPPGIGKTTAAHLIAKLEGYDIVESNASDTRSKKLVETGLKGVLSTTSLMGYFAPGSESVDASKKKLVLIMDEVDGMSAGDRGGVGALAAVCKKTQIPMILICNDRKLPKMKPFDFVTYDLPFRRPTTDQIRSRINTIAFREGLKMPQNVINALIEGSNADIRQVVNMISTAKLDSANLTFESSKDMTKAWEKHIILKPWDMVGKILGGGLFNPASGSSLNDKQELYFNDHEFAPLMLQENYLGTKPQRANKYDGNMTKRKLADLELVSRAAESISDGDLIDRMIHGSQQQWSLMPAHAMFSFVRPASFVCGSMAGSQTRFTSWLGKNSNQGKLMRFLKEIQGHMRLRVSADRFEVRQTYVPVLFTRIIEKLASKGKETVPEIIDLMDSYFLTKDDWDAILELGVGPHDMERVKIESAAKATFTRLYNQQAHPLPFIKASQVTQTRKSGAKERPDLEEALEESDEGEVVEEDAGDKDDEDVDLSKDKYVKQPKKKKTPAAKAGGAGPAKKRKAKDIVDDEDDIVDDDSEEDVKPKKGKGKAKAKK